MGNYKNALLVNDTDTIVVCVANTCHVECRESWNGMEKLAVFPLIDKHINEEDADGSVQLGHRSGSGFQPE